jgi:hypothetical protein
VNAPFTSLCHLDDRHATEAGPVRGGKRLCTTAARVGYQHCTIVPLLVSGCSLSLSKVDAKVEANRLTATVSRNPSSFKLGFDRHCDRDAGESELTRHG